MKEKRQKLIQMLKSRKIFNECGAAQGQEEVGVDSERFVEEVIQLIDELTENGKNPDALDFTDKEDTSINRVNAILQEENTPLHLAAQNDLDKRIFFKIADTCPKLLDKPNRFKYAPIHYVLACQDPNKVETLIDYLIEKRADFSCSNDEENTPLHIAAQNFNTSVQENVEHRIFDKVYQACPRIRDVQNSIGWTPLHTAQIYQRPGTVEYLKAKHADVNITDRDGKKYSDYIRRDAVNGHAAQGEFDPELMQMNIELMRLVVAIGESVGQIAEIIRRRAILDNDLNLAVMLIRNETFDESNEIQMETFKRLINNVQNLNKPIHEVDGEDYLGGTLLHIAACYNGGRKKCIEYLLSRPGINLSIKNELGKTAEESTRNMEIKRILANTRQRAQHVGVEMQVG